MASVPISSILEQHQVRPPPATVGNRSLPLTFYDMFWIRPNVPPVHTVSFYELQITTTHFIQTVIPDLKNSLSITLQHFFPFAGKLIVIPTPTRKPEIRYIEGDSVSVTFAESTLDFDNLTGYHPRDCDQFYHLIPLLGEATQESDYVSSIPLFSVQVTVFPNSGLCIGLTNHHSLCDARSRFSFLNAWASIARYGDDKSFLATETLPCFDRLIDYPKLDEIYLKNAKVKNFIEEYGPSHLSGPSDKVRVTVVLTRTVINKLKKRVSTQFPTLPYVSSFTVACGYIWSCIAKSRNDELELFRFTVDCRARMDPPIPTAYFGNCLTGCLMVAKTIDLITGMEGFVIAAKMIGENLHKLLTDKDGIVKDIWPTLNDLFADGMPTTTIGVAGTPKIKFYDLDFGWGKPKKYEMISIDYSCSISINASKQSSEDFEIGVSLSASEMKTFLSSFDDGLKNCI